MCCLTDEEKYQNKMHYIELLQRINVDLSTVLPYLESINYFEAPASYQYIKAYAGGLCQYALTFCRELGSLCEAYFPGKYTDEDIIKVALFRDVYRAVMTETYTKNVKNDVTGQWESVVAYRTKENRPAFGEVGFSSYMCMRKLIDFSDEQIEAICQASYMTSFAMDMHNIRRDYPLVTLATMADMATVYFETEVV